MGMHNYCAIPVYDEKSIAHFLRTLQVTLASFITLYVTFSPVIMICFCVNTAVHGGEHRVSGEFVMN